MNAAQPKARKPRPKPARSIRLLEQPAADGWFAVEIHVGKQADTYLCRAIPAGYEIEKYNATLTEAVESYIVTLDAEAASCSCPGHQHHRHCKHVDGLEALRRAGKLLPFASADGPERAA